MRVVAHQRVSVALGGEPPALEHLAHCAQPHQRLNRPASPKRKAQLVLFWHLVEEQNLDLLLLPKAQCALLAGLTPSRLGLDTPNPFSLIRPPSIRYRIAVHLQLISNVFNCRVNSLRREEKVSGFALIPGGLAMFMIFFCLCEQPVHRADCQRLAFST